MYVNGKAAYHNSNAKSKKDKFAQGALGAAAAGFTGVSIAKGSLEWAGAKLKKMNEKPKTADEILANPNFNVK